MEGKFSKKNFIAFLLFYHNVYIDIKLFLVKKNRIVHQEKTIKKQR
jgi:hypothetical protein